MAQNNSQLLQRRNVLDHLTEARRPLVARKLSTAYALENYAAPKQALNTLHRELMDFESECGTESGEEFEETLTVHRLHGVGRRWWPRNNSAGSKNTNKFRSFSGSVSLAPSKPEVVKRRKAS